MGMLYQLTRCYKIQEVFMPFYARIEVGTTGLAVWTDSETLLLVKVGYGFDLRASELTKWLHLVFPSGDEFPMQIRIYGNSDDAIAETAARLWRLDKNESISIFGHDFNNAAFQPEQLAALFSYRPGREVEIIAWNIATVCSVAFATQPDPIRLALKNVTFQDGGVTFCSHLQTRQTTFGLLTVDNVEQQFLR